MSGGWWDDDRWQDDGGRWNPPHRAWDLIASILGWLLVILVVILVSAFLTAGGKDESPYYGKGGDHAVQVVSGSATEADRWQVGG